MEAKQRKLSFRYLVQKYAWPFRGLIFSLVIVTLLANIITTAQPIALAGVLNIIMKPTETKSDGPSSKLGPSNKLLDLNNLGSRVVKGVSGYAGSTWNAMILLLAFYVFFVVIATGLNYLATVLSIYIESRATRLITNDLLSHILSLNLDFFNKQKSGELISRIMIDARDTANGVGPLVRSLFHQGILIIIYSYYLFSTNAYLTIGAFLLILAQFGLTELVKRPTGKMIYLRADIRAEFSNILHEIFTSFRVVKSFGGEKFELQRVNKGIENLTRADVKVGVMKQLGEESRSILDALAMVGIVAIASIQLMKGTLTLQGFALFVLVGQMLITPINKFAVNVYWTQALIASYRKIDEILKVKPNIVDGPITKKDFKSSIEIRNVSFSYGHGLVLKEVSFAVKKGEIVAIVGPSGAGKSTLVDLVMRFYNPTEGDIYIDKVNLKEIKYDEYRRIFGVVSQRNQLFNDTVRNNIVYGRDYLKDEDVIRAAKVANAHEFIMELPRGYDTLVGEKGIFLSGGQCQRIAIARAVVSGPYILILDEATSSLDSESERQVQMAIDKVLENSTAIVIAHRLSTILHAHKIIVLQKGKIEAIGKHEELLLKSPTYKVLYSLQFASVKINGEEKLGTV